MRAASIAVVALLAAPAFAAPLAVSEPIVVNTPTQTAGNALSNLLNKVWKSLRSYFMEESVVQQVITELLKLIGVTSFNDLLMRRNFCSWKRGMHCVKSRFAL